MGDPESTVPVTRVFAKRCLESAWSIHCERNHNIHFSFLNYLVWKTFRRFPTTPEWAHFRKYARRMRWLGGPNALRSVSLEVFSALQSCAIDEPLFPNLRTLEFRSATGEIVPFIPLFLSPRTITIEIRFTGRPSLHKATVPPLLATLQTMCPNLEDVSLQSLPSDPMTTAAVSGMLLASSRNALRSLHVDSPLAEGTLEVICKLPNLRALTVVLEG